MTKFGALLERNNQSFPPRTMHSKFGVLSSVASDLPPRGFYHPRSPASFQLQSVLLKVVAISKHHLFWEKQEEIDSCLISPLPPGSPLPAPPHRSNIEKKKIPHRISCERKGKTRSPEEAVAESAVEPGCSRALAP